MSTVTDMIRWLHPEGAQLLLNEENWGFFRLFDTVDGGA